MRSYLSQLTEGFVLLHGIVTLLVGLFHVWLWVKSGFAIPRYIHVMAWVAALIGVWVLYLQPVGGPAVTGDAQGYLLTALIFSGLVYATFVFFGGAVGAQDAKNHPRPEDGWEPEDEDADRS